MDYVGRNHRFTDCRSLLLFNNPAQGLNGHFCGITTREYGDFRSSVCQKTGKNLKLMEKLGCNSVVQMIPGHKTRHYLVDTEARAVNYYECDAISLIRSSSDDKPLLLGNTGDCPTIAIFNEQNLAAMLIHISLWNIGLNFIPVVIGEFSRLTTTPASSLYGYIWPGISQSFYEVEDNYIKILPKKFASCFRPKRNGYCLFNFGLAVLIELEQSGLNSDRCCLVPGCSQSSQNESGGRLFYSARNGDSFRNGIFFAFT